MTIPPQPPGDRAGNPPIPYFWMPLFHEPRDAAEAGPNPPSPIRWALAPIRARLMVAAALAATAPR